MTLPDTSYTSYQYQGNQVTVTDPALKWKTFTMDAFGNLVSVVEPDPSLGNVTTNYTYDILNHLTAVSMPRGSNTQTRTFNYNSGTTVTGFLQSATNPENGTVTYTYGNGLLATKTDAKNQKLAYSYDGYNRLTSVGLVPTYTCPPPPQQCIPPPNQVLRTYYYDTNPLDTTGFSQNPAGRLTAVQYPAQSTVQMNEMYSYSVAGLPVAKRFQAFSPWPRTLPMETKSLFPPTSGASAKDFLMRRMAKSRPPLTRACLKAFRPGLSPPWRASIAGPG